jgi:hypothetical protein
MPQADEDQSDAERQAAQQQRQAEDTVQASRAALEALVQAVEAAAAAGDPLAQQVRTEHADALLQTLEHLFSQRANSAGEAGESQTARCPDEVKSWVGWLIAGTQLVSLGLFVGLVALAVHFLKPLDDWSFLSRILLAGAVGAWAFSFLVHLYNALRYPGMLGDGQYIFIFYLTVPVGWLLGSSIGALLAYHTVPPPHPTPWKIIGLIVGGVLGSPLVMVFGQGLIWLTITVPVELIRRVFR